MLPGSATCRAAENSRHLASSEVSQSEAEGPATTQPRILMVDDEKLLADTTAAILRRAGYDAKTAYDGFGALETSDSFHPEYLLTDIMMPGMNGMELAIVVARMYMRTKICCSRAKPASLPSWKKAEQEDANSRFWQNPCIRRSWSKGSAC
jgi:DNA-binding NtrC family response regulator